jgi:phage baseplate assembly protein gpV
MAMTDYRRTRADSSGQPWMDSLRREVAAEVADEMRALKKELSELRSQLSGKQMHVNVAAPSVSVAPPNVSVTSPEVEVAVDMAQLTKSMASLEATVQALTVMLSKTITREVHRGTDNLIKTITEKRT